MHCKEISFENQWNDHPRENTLIFEQILSTNSFNKETYGDQFGEFVCGYLGLKG